jgi:hypothetical protein
MSSGDQEAADDGRALFPLEPGMTWTFESHVDSAASRDEIRVLQVTGEVVVGDVECAILEVRTDGRLTGTDWLQSDGDGIRLRRTTLEGSAHDIVPPDFRLRFPARAGASWEWTGSLPKIGDVVLRHRGEGPEKVTVPAGTFDAFKVVTQALDPKLLKQAESLSLTGLDVKVEPHVTLTRWYAHGVGPIREVFETNGVRVTSVLKAFAKAAPSPGAPAGGLGGK